MKVGEQDSGARALPKVQASAVSGIRSAGERADRAALAVTRAFHSPSVEGLAKGATVSFSNESRDLAAATVDLQSAKAAQKANVAVLRTDAEMTDELVRLVSPRP